MYLTRPTRMTARRHPLMCCHCHVSQHCVQPMPQTRLLHRVHPPSHLTECHRLTRSSHYPHVTNSRRDASSFQLGQLRSPMHLEHSSSHHSILTRVTGPGLCSGNCEIAGACEMSVQQYLAQHFMTPRQSITSSEPSHAPGMG